MQDYYKILERLTLVVTHVDTEVVGKTTYKGEIPDFSWDSSPKNPFSEPEAGRIYYVIDGESVVLSKKGLIKMTAGNVYLFPPDSIIATRCDKYMFHSYIHFYEEDTFDLFNIFDYSGKYKATEQTASLFKTIKTSLRVDNPSGFFNGKAAFYQLMCPFWNKPQKINTNAQRLSKVLQFIDMNLDKDLSLEILAKEANYNPNYFSNFFRKTFGVTPSKYIAGKRVFFAKTLLLNTFSTVGEIATQCGYTDIYSFSRFFKINTGHYPSEYRKLFAKGNLTQYPDSD